MDKKKEIISKILAIPLEKWNGYNTELNGVKIFLNPTHTNMGKFFEINGIQFSDDRVNNFMFRLDEFRNKNEEDSERDKINEIYNSLCGED